MAVKPEQIKAFAGKSKPKTPPPAPEPDGDEPPVEEDAEAEGVENTGETDGDGDVSTDEQLAQDVMAKVAGGDVDEELVELVGSADAVDGTFPWVKSPEIWTRAQQALDPDDIPQGTDPFVVLAHVYMALGGEVDGLGEAPPEGGEAGAPEATPPQTPPTPPAAPPGPPKAT